jgi:hypothetical protein
MPVLGPLERDTYYYNPKGSTGPDCYDEDVVFPDSTGFQPNPVVTVTSNPDEYEWQVKKAEVDANGSYLILIVRIVARVDSPAPIGEIRVTVSSETPTFSNTYPGIQYLPRT